MQIDFHQDFASSSVDSYLNTWLGTGATVVVKPTSGSVTATNPSYSGVFLVSSVSTIAGSIGDLATQSLTWPLASGTVTRATS